MNEVSFLKHFLLFVFAIVFGACFGMGIGKLIFWLFPF